MREFRTDPIMAGYHFLIDGEEFVAEEPNGRECDSCALGKSNKCYSIPCDNVIFKSVKKEPQDGLSSIGQKGLIADKDFLHGRR